MTHSMHLPGNPHRPCIAALLLAVVMSSSAIPALAQNNNNNTFDQRFQIASNDTQANDTPISDPTLTTASASEAGRVHIDNEGYAYLSSQLLGGSR